MLSGIFFSTARSYDSKFVLPALFSRDRIFALIKMDAVPKKLTKRIAPYV